MRGIIVIFTILVAVNCQQTQFTENDIRQLQKALHQSTNYMRKEVKNEDASICIGAIRAGKSTLINYLIGTKLKFVRHSRNAPITIEKVDNQSKGPAIGRGATTKTKIPTRWVSDVHSNMSIWDSPGFDDNRGTVQDITNAYYLYQLLQSVNSLKIILTIDINDILHDNIKPFISVLSAVENLLGEKMRNFYSSISVILTKVPNTLEGVPVDMEFINEKLADQFLSNFDIDLSNNSKAFVEHFIKHNEQMGYMKRPEIIGNITTAVDVNIFPAITSTKSIPKNNLQQLRPSISETSQLYLYGIRNTLYSKAAFEELQNGIDSLVDKKVINADNLNYDDDKHVKHQLKLMQKTLKNIDNDLINATSSDHDFFKRIEILKMMDNSIAKTINENHLLETVTLIEFVDKLLDLQEGKILSKKLEKVLSSSRLKVRSAISSIREQLGEITH
ncbi:uncharacterized protein LOC122508705 [Leptopilina heterotoma]|uniref:uncharacterized protein LOC122508705 n=1 Tax=Leptopilina heterotoma TaxID=63436 RepID=UPI001CAA3776|nr:uncharacterized protein LOC122508705 [Leptopilina heterotoma]XP_043478147.1 uncharacterized protein LOC122508705 [Leptopilina heterotoma]